MTSVWAGRWGEYHKIKKKMEEWYRKGVSMDDIEERVRTNSDNNPVKLRVVNND